MSADLVEQFVTDLIRCLEREIWYAGSDSSRPRRICASEYVRIDAAWADLAVSAFTTDLLNDGASAADALKADELMRACLGRLRAQGRSLENAATECRMETRVALGQQQSAVQPPVISGISCSSAGSSMTGVTAGQPVACSATVTGTVTERRWSAPGGSPSSGDGESLTTTYGTDGTKSVELTACNVVRNDDADRIERARACAVAMTTVTVNPVEPTIDALSCGPAIVMPGAVVTCSATVGSTTSATTRGWSAPGGDPASGRGPSFSVTFAQPERRTITFTACNGSACAERSSTVEVRAAATPSPTATAAPRCQQWDVSGTWQTSASNNYNATFSFQQSGTSISGTATLPAHEQARAGYTSPTGSLSGTLVGDQFDVTVTWAGRSGPVRGRYTGTVVQGRITNGTADAFSWNGSGPTRCVRQA